ncbi:hypothetical protein Tco_1335425 [Tanacetum coccineum]
MYTGGVLEKDPAPHLTARQEQAVQILSSNKAPFRRYPECFLALVGLSPYYPFGENTYPAFERPDGTDMGLLDYIRTADPRKVQTVEVRKGEEQVTLFDSIKHCFVSLDAPAAAHQASGSGSGAGAEVSAPSVEGNVVEENVIPESASLNPIDPECDVTLAEKDVAQRQPEKAKRKKLLKRSDPLPAKRLRTDHPSLASGTGGKSLASLRQSLPEGSFTLGVSSPADIPTHVTVFKYIPGLKLRGKYDARGVLLREKDAEIAKLKSLLKEKETESAEDTDTLLSLILVASYLKSALDDSQAACDEARSLISSLSSERDGLASEPWIMYQEGLGAAGHEHGIAGTPLSAVVAYDPETAKNNYFDAVRALEEADFPLIHLLKSKKDSGMDEVLDCFPTGRTFGKSSPEAAYFHSRGHIKLSVPIYYADINAVVGETSLSFALLNVHNRAEGARKHAAALRRLMMDIVSHPLSSRNLLG